MTNITDDIDHSMVHFSMYKPISDFLTGKSFEKSYYRIKQDIQDNIIKLYFSIKSPLNS